MNRRRITAIASIVTPVAVGLALGLAVVSGATASTSTVSTSTAVTTGTAASTAVITRAAAPEFVALGCDLKGQVMPTQYVLACGDGNAGLNGLHWASWTPQLASGYGTYFVNDCKPDCAAGHFHSYPALALLWGSGGVAGHPAQRRYTQVTLVFTGARPPFYDYVNGKRVTTRPATQTWPLWP
jgi:hypothetical protein